jgi:Fur family ferric uptake transcriptional regulator
MKEGAIASSREWCQKFGLRFTKTRDLIFRHLKKARQPLSAPELMFLFEKEGEGLNKTTLYRELENLVSLGALQKVQLSLERVSYELANYHHHHFVCESCLSVTEVSFTESIVAEVEKKLLQRGNRVLRHTFEFFGLCHKCC